MPSNPTLVARRGHLWALRFAGIVWPIYAAPATRTQPEMTRAILGPSWPLLTRSSSTPAGASCA